MTLLPLYSSSPIANQDDVNFVASTLSSLTPNGGTYMVPGLNVAASQFTSDSTTEKVFLMLADGDFDDSTWFGIIPIPNKDGILNAAKKIKDNGATAYTIGFAADVDILKDIASDPSKYSTAGDATTLNSIFAQITEEIKGVYVTDTMGANVSLRPGTAFAAAVSGTAHGNQRRHYLESRQAAAGRDTDADLHCDPQPSRRQKSI